MICRICGQESLGERFAQWVRPTFTDWDKLLPGTIICDDCAFWFNERSVELAQLVGKEKPQRMRNYSHFIVNDKWIPLSKGDKKRMQELLLSFPFPELAVIAESGQKHIAFRAPRNQPGAISGWIQFEEHSIFVEPPILIDLLKRIEMLYVQFSKKEIETGNYNHYRILEFGLERWNEYEQRIKPQRHTLLFKLALFLAQKGEKDDATARDGNSNAGHRLARNPGRLQKPLSKEHLGTIRGSDKERRVYQQSGEIYQLTLLKAPNQSGNK